MLQYEKNSRLYVLFGSMTTLNNAMGESASVVSTLSFLFWFRRCVEEG
jgi:hypothetical protein